jgi:hypothetical protein
MELLIADCQLLIDDSCLPIRKDLVAGVETISKKKDGAGNMPAPSNSKAVARLRVYGSIVAVLM